MHEMQTIITDVRGVCQSVRQSVCLSRRAAGLHCAGGYSVQPLLNNFGFLLVLTG